MKTVDDLERRTAEYQARDSASTQEPTSIARRCSSRSSSFASDTTSFCIRSRAASVRARAASSRRRARSAFRARRWNSSNWLAGRSARLRQPRGFFAGNGASAGGSAGGTPAGSGEEADGGSAEVPPRAITTSPRRSTAAMQLLHESRASHEPAGRTRGTQRRWGGWLALPSSRPQCSCRKSP